MRVKKDIPLITLLTLFLFIFVYAFKLGEAYFFGYPSYYIYLDTSEVINASLKLLIIYINIFCAALLVQDDKKLIYALLAFTIIAKIIRIILHFREGDLTTSAAINLGSIWILIPLLMLCIPNACRNTFNSIDIKPGRSLLVVGITMVLSFFIGWNYHSFFPGNVWQTIDQKVVVGRYQNNFILRQCTQGNAYFFLQPIANSKFQMFAIDTSGVLMLRCKPEIDTLNKDDYFLQKEDKRNPA